MTTIESREIRGITLKVLYLLVAFSITATAGIMTSYFSLKSDNQLLSTQIEVLKIQFKTIDKRLEKMESKKDNESLKEHLESKNSNEKSLHNNNFLAAAVSGLQVAQGSDN